MSVPVTPMRTISFGGLGDAFIVGLKLNQLASEEDIYKYEAEIQHLFVESNPKTLELIKEHVAMFWTSKYFKFEFDCDSNYQESYFNGKWLNCRPLNTTWHGEYHFPQPDGIKLTDDFATLLHSRKPKYDVCIQVAAGTNSSRHWKFDPRKLRNLLKSKGYKVALVGTDEEYKEDESDNFVCETDLVGSINVVANCEIYCGLSGFHSYQSMARGIKNVHLEESSEHNAHYIHPSWEKNRYGIKHGSLSEVIAGLRHWGVEI